MLLVDDHAVVRSGLSFFLSSADDIEVIGEAAMGGWRYAYAPGSAPTWSQWTCCCPG